MPPSTGSTQSILVGYLRRRRCFVGCRFHFVQALWGVGDREGRSMTLSNHRDVNTENFPQPFVALIMVMFRINAVEQDEEENNRRSRRRRGR
jgi:hypothetical protein